MFSELSLQRKKRRMMEFFKTCCTFSKPKPKPPIVAESYSLSMKFAAFALVDCLSFLDSLNV
uniref:Uncharacterized protein LOC104236555 n=1 Tax=Nicotiana sylvestris TaxID=4096 RepID=A0A1U7XQN8_NICSY|nr:PREDICTED: uncharacterized protein LOC104236555 [Nicotiana sylvestris]